MILYWYIINYILKILDKRLSTCEIIYTDPLNADTDGDGLKDGEEIIPQFKFVDSSSIGLPGVSCGICFNMLSDPNMSDSDGDGYSDKEDLAPMIKYKNPVILIHGRGDNSKNCFGIENHITQEDNNGYGYENTSDFSDVDKQKLLNSTAENSIARKLVDDGYVANENLFAFNYPNQDVTYINAIILQNYIYNLSNSNTSSLFFVTKSDKKNKNVKFDIIAHSNGGLVSRYYIENLGGDSYIRKLITIDTPHYGSTLATFSDMELLTYTSIICPMDFDLSSNSRLFTGNTNIYIDTLFPISFQSRLFTYYFNHQVNYALNHQSPKLNGNKNVSTEYYAIGGIAYGDNITKNPVAINFVRSRISVYSFIQQIKLMAYNRYGIDISGLASDSNDNIIDIMTQFGLKSNNNDIIDYINFHNTTAIITGSNEYSFSNGNYWHNGILWDNSTHETIIQYLIRS